LLFGLAVSCGRSGLRLPANEPADAAPEPGSGTPLAKGDLVVADQRAADVSGRDLPADSWRKEDLPAADLRLVLLPE